MAQVVKVYRQKIPAARFIGKRYGEEDRKDGGFGEKWCEWFAKGWFEAIKGRGGAGDAYENWDDFVGLMRWKEGEPFEYWIGLFAAPDARAPEGFQSADFPAGELGVAWLSGKEDEVYGQEEMCATHCQREGMKIVPDASGAYWFFERYACPRFTVPDERGHIILDICHYIAEK